MELCETIVAVFGCLIFSCFLNVSVILFIAFAINTSISSSENTNVIAYVCLAVFYCLWGGLLFLVCYFAGFWDPIIEKYGLFLVLIICIFYPLSLLIALPWTMFQLWRFLGSPVQLWESCFHDSCYSLSRISLIDSGSVIVCIGRAIYIGIPFVIYAFIYILLFFLFFPIYYVLFSPFGFGSSGIVIPIYLSEQLHGTFWEKYEDCWYSSYIYMVFGPALCGIVFGIVYICILSATWFAILLIVTAGLYFLLFIYPAFSSFGCNSITQVV